MEQKPNQDPNEQANGTNNTNNTQDAQGDSQIQDESEQQIDSQQNQQQDVEMKLGSSLADPDVDMAQENQPNSSESPGIHKKVDEPENAPIEIRQKQQDQQKQQTIQIQQEASEKRNKLKEQVVRLFKQITNGCSKYVCLNPNCKKNPFAKEELAKLKTSQEILLYATKVITKESDASRVLCSECVLIDKENLESFDNEKLLDVYNDFFQFSMSFLQPLNPDEAVRLRNGDPDPFEYLKYDYETMNKFLAKSRAAAGDDLHDKLGELMGIIDHELSIDAVSSEFIPCLIRGLIIMLIMDEAGDFQSDGTFENTMVYFKKCLDKVRASKDEFVRTFPVQFLAKCLRKHEFLNCIQQFNNYITIVISQGQIRQDIIQFTIEIMDIFYQANRIRPKKEQVENHEFYNDALNHDVDLRKQAKIYIQEYNSAKNDNREFDRHSFFTLYNYPWTLNAYKKSEPLHILASIDRQQAINQAILSNLTGLMNPNQSQNQTFNQILGDAHFTLKIRRELILEDALQAIVKDGTNQSKIKKPLRVIFENEPAIDEGGVKKEFFQLLMKELFNPDYGMFIYNPDNRLYWFNGQTYESNINFELIGLILALAPNNQVILNIPILSVCYKHLLGEKPTLEDLEMWQPDVYQSFKYMMNYKDEAPLEDIIQRTFTIDMEIFAEMRTFELIPNGKEVFVTKENCMDFIDKYIEFLFIKQCEPQINAFKRGFYKLFDEKMLKLLYTSEELEQYVVGSKDLDFKELKRCAKYIQPLHPNHQFVKWFWEIVLDDFDDKQRRQLLAFTTGSDRAPITGLEDVEFILGIEGTDEEKLPIAHTCFNQLLLPDYQTKEKMKAKLTQAVENCEGFGMV